MISAAYCRSSASAAAACSGSKFPPFCNTYNSSLGRRHIAREHRAPRFWFLDQKRPKACLRARNVVHFIDSVFTTWSPPSREVSSFPSFLSSRRRNLELWRYTTPSSRPSRTTFDVCTATSTVVRRALSYSAFRTVQYGAQQSFACSICRPRCPSRPSRCLWCGNLPRICNHSQRSMANWASIFLPTTYHFPACVPRKIYLLEVPCFTSGTRLCGYFRRAAQHHLQNL